uniref:Uncharacterized protein n=1 Tax=Salix viminalis TaxID=40686 RepID=A0A6N2M3P7_SALVM
MAWFLVGLSRRSVVSLREFSASVGCSIRAASIPRAKSVPVFNETGFYHLAPVFSVFVPVDGLLIYEDVNHSASKNGSPLATPLLPTTRSHGCSG